MKAKVIDLRREWDGDGKADPEDERIAAIITAGGQDALSAAHKTFRKWLGEDYDMDALDATLAVAAAERLEGDPPWLLIISGPGNAKTETVQALGGSGATVTSTITSEAALLSGTPERQRAESATGGLLRRLGGGGVLVIKDVTSILAMDRNIRAGVLAALREVHDGRWERNLGTDGGLSLGWEGRLVVVGAVTTAWDQAHAVISSLGDRFVLLRLDSNKGRAAAGRQSRRNTGHEKQMRQELAGAVGNVLKGMNRKGIELTDEEGDRLLGAADVVTLARTGVEYDYRGDVVDAHAPEMPTRFLKQLGQVVRGGVAIGMDRQAALRLGLRCARDSMPPLRLAIIEDVALHPHSGTSEVRRRLGKPRAAVDRQLQALHLLGVLSCDEEEDGRRGTLWRYSLAEGINPRALDVPDLLVPTPNPDERKGEKGTSEGLFGDTTHISGTSGNGYDVPFPDPEEHAETCGCGDCFVPEEF